MIERVRDAQSDTQLGIFVGALRANAGRGAVSLFVTGGTPLISTAAETITSMGGAGYGNTISALGN